MFVALYDGFETVNLTCTDHKFIIILSTTLNYNNIYFCDLSRRPVRDFFRRRRRCYFIKIFTLAHDFTFFWSRSRYLYCLIIIYICYIVSATEFRNVRLLYYHVRWSIVGITIYRSTLDHGRYLHSKQKISCWIRDAYHRTIIIICVTQYSILLLCYLSVPCYTSAHRIVYGTYSLDHVYS